MPKPPQLVYRTASEVCLRPKAFQPIKKPGMVEAPRVASYAVYGKAAGASGVAASRRYLLGRARHSRPEAGWGRSGVG